MAGRDLIAKLQIENANAKQKIEELKAKVKDLDQQCKILGRNAKSTAKGSADAFKMWGDNLKGANTVTGKLQRGFTSVISPVNELTSQFGLNITAIGKFINPTTATIAAIAALGKAFVDCGEVAHQFDESFDNMSFFSGESNISQFQDMAKQMASTQGFTFDLTEFADAFKSIQMIARAQKELVDDDSLQKYTAELDQFATIVADQFNETSTQANAEVTKLMTAWDKPTSQIPVITSLLLNGAKEGMTSTQEFSQALTSNAGTAQAAGVSLETLAAATAMLAPKFGGAEGGASAFLSVMSKLEAKGTNDLKPSIVGVNQALLNLQKKFEDGADVSDIFGARQINNARYVASFSKEIAGLSKNMDDSTTKEKAAEAANEDLEASQADLNNSWKALKATIGAPWTQIYKGFIDATRSAVDTVNGWIGSLIKSWKELQNTMRGGATDPNDISVSSQVAKVSKAGTKGQSIAQHNKTMAQYRKTIAAYNQQIADADKQLNNASAAWKSGGMENAVLGRSVSIFQQKKEQLIKEKNAVLAEWKDFRNKSMKYINGLDVKPQKPDPKDNGNGNGNGSKTTKTKTETPLEKYNKQIQASAAAYKQGLINEEEEIQKQISATETYISSLSENEASINKNADVIKNLNTQVDNFKSRLEEIKINKNYIDDMNDATQKLTDGMIDVDEYDKKYRSALQKVIDEYYNIDNISEEQRKEQQNYIKKLKEFDVAQAERQKNGGRSSQAEANLSLEKAISRYFNVLKEYHPNQNYINKNDKRIEKSQEWTGKYDTEKKDAQETAATLGITFDLKAFESSFAEKYKSELAKMGIEYDGKDLFVQLGVEYLKNQTLDAEFEVDKQHGYKGDKSNYGINAQSADSKEKEVNADLGDTGPLEDLENELDRLLEKYREMQDALVDVNVATEESGAVLDNSFTKSLESVGNQIEKVKTKIKSMTTTQKALSSLSESFSNLGNAIIALGVDADTSAVLMVMMAIAQIAASFAQALSTCKTWYEWLAFAISGTATMISTIAAVKNATSMASGGIVPGTQFAGDQVNAHLNSGEMVLNTQQQRNLFNALDNGFAASGGLGNVEFTIRGSELYGTLKNYGRTTPSALKF